MPKSSEQMPSERDYADVRSIGIPRSLLYFRYNTLWQTFFEELGRDVIVSPPTDKSTLVAGAAVSVDECCLASKVYMGHVVNLIDRTDALFVPCYASVDPQLGFCTKFQSITDMVKTTFRDRQTRVMSLLVAEANDEKQTGEAYIELARCMNATDELAKRAWLKASAAQAAIDAECAEKQNALVSAIENRRRLRDERTRTNDSNEKDIPDTEEPLAILLVAHPYIAHDYYLCGAIVDTLESMGATVLYADETDHKQALEKSFDFAKTLPWIISRELIGSILLLHDMLNGIVIVSAYPCGPDSMTNDAIMRRIRDLPILNLMIDEQSSTTGIETRIESFVDILRFQQKGGYVGV